VTPALSVTRQSGLCVTVLEALSMRQDPDSEFQARHLAMAEASRGYAESVTAILQAIHDLTSLLTALVYNGEDDVEAEKAAY
jgi:formiminotetrahydrofolate cyclodeaminase